MGALGGEGPPGSEFEKAVSDARPMEGRDAVVPPARTVRRRRRREGAEAAGFEVERLGERVEGLAPGIDRAFLRRLRSGEFPVEARLDLHGLQESAAQRAVHEAIARLCGEGGRCLLVIHGRGRGSEAGPVLKEALPRWLTESPSAERVMAFSSARGRDGGVGATYVLLRRER